MGAGQGVVKYFTDEGGSWNAAAAPQRGGTALKQVITQRPIEWRPRSPEPSTYIGDANGCPSFHWQPPCGSTNYTVSVDVLVEAGASSPEASGVYVELCGRIH